MPLNPLFVDAFTRGTENPLANNQWGRFQETGSNIASMKLGDTGNPCEASTVNVRNANIVTGVAFGADQWAELTVKGTPGAFTSAAVRLRGTSGNPGTAYDIAISGTTWTIQTASGTTFTTIATGTGVALQNRDVIRFEAIGTTLTAYQNNKQIVTVVDATFNSGAPGIRVNPGASVVTTIQFSQFRAGDFSTPNVSLGKWTKRGVVMVPLAADTPGQPNVLYETGAVILTPNGDGKIWKMWFGTANGMCYAESNDALAWTRYVSNPVAVPTGTPSAGWNAYPRIFKNSGTYYAYIVNKNFLSMSSWTSSDGVTGWTQQVANAITPSQPSWNTGFTGQLSVLGQSGGTWYGYYTGYNGTNYAMGLATSTDLLNWTADAGNPKITAEGPSNFCFAPLPIGGLYYGWSQIVQPGIPAFGSNGIPSDITRYSSPSLSGPWTPLPPSTIYRTDILMEGEGTTVGQVADPAIIELNGTTYMFATNTATGNGSPTNYQIELFTTPYTIAQLVSSYEGIASIPMPSTLYGFLNQLTTAATDTFTVGDPNFTTMTAAGGWGAPTFNSGNATGTANGIRGTAYWSARSWPANQWASIKVSALNATSYVAAMVRGSTSGAATCYMLVAGQGTLGTSNVFVFLQKFVANTFSQLYAAQYTVSANDILTISAVDSIIAIYQNGNLLFNIVDTAIATGSPGISLTPDATPADAKITQFQAGTMADAVISNSAPTTITITMKDGSTVAVAVPNGYTASQYINSLRLSGGVFSQTAVDPGIGAQWWPYREWQKAVTS